MARWNRCQLSWDNSGQTLIEREIQEYGPPPHQWQSSRCLSQVWRNKEVGLTWYVKQINTDSKYSVSEARTKMTLIRHRLENWLYWVSYVLYMQYGRHQPSFLRNTSRLAWKILPLYREPSRIEILFWLPNQMASTWRILISYRLQQGFSRSSLESMQTLRRRILILKSCIREGAILRSVVDA